MVMNLDEANGAVRQQQPLAAGGGVDDDERW